MYNLITALPPKKESDLPTLDLHANDEDMESSIKIFPQKRDDYFNAFARVHKELSPVKMKLRGDNAYHWFADQKSWRVRFPNTQAFLGEDTWNLINPRSFTGMELFLGDRLAESFGVLSARSGFGRVFINQRFQGVYQFVSHMNETWLRRRRRIPGDVYVGEKGRMWNDPLLWTKTAFYQSNQKEDRSPLTQFLNVLSEAQPFVLFDAGRFRESFEKIADVNVFLRSWATQVVAGSMHQDSSHNQKLYWDPSSGKIEPIIWDTFGHGQYYELEEDLDAPLTPIHLALLRFPDLLLEKDRMIFQFVEKDKKERMQHAWVDQYTEESRADFRSSPVLDYGYMTRLPFRPLNFPRWVLKSKIKAIHGFIDRRNDMLGRVLHRFDGQWAWLKNGKGHITGYLDLSGYAPIQIEKIFLNGKSVPFRLYWENSSESLLLTKPLCFSARGLISGGMWHSQHWGVQAPYFYRFEVQGLESANSISVVWKNAVTDKRMMQDFPVKSRLPENWQASRSSLYLVNGKPLSDEKREKLQIVTNEGLRHFYGKGKKRKSLVFGPGRVLIRESLTLKSDTEITVKPGTNLIFQDGAILTIEGKALFLGENARPIIVTQNEQLKMGSGILLIGKGTRGSEFRHCHFSNMGIDQERPIRLLAMLNIHHTADVEVSHCEFKDNQAGDDALHVLNVDNFKLNNSRFANIRSDGTDLDYVTGKILSCQFHGSKNDGLDLMGSLVEVEGNDFADAGDKGISVGERSYAAVIFNSFRRNNIPLQSKDESRVYFAGNILEENKASIQLLHKNDRYGSPYPIQEESNISSRPGSGSISELFPHLRSAIKTKEESWLSQVSSCLAPDFQNWRRCESAFRN